MTDRLVKTVRLQEGLRANGNTVDDSGSVFRVVHLVALASDLDTPEGVTACCGAWFAPGALVEVPWGELWPHHVCVMRAPWSRRAMEASFLATETATGLAGRTSAEMATSFAVSERLMKARFDWVDATEAGGWEFSASFNGILFGDHRFPRGRDLGLEPLTAELVRAGVFRIYSCGVRDGCPKHATYSETFSLNDVSVILEGLAKHERLAASIDLQELTWCLIVGSCSETVTDAMF
jgi:hypothetical protein